MARGSYAAKVRLWRERFLRFDDGGRTVAGRGVFEPVTIAAAAVVIRLPGGTLIEVPAHSEQALRVIVSQLAGDNTEAAPC